MLHSITLSKIVKDAKKELRTKGTEIDSNLLVNGRNYGMVELHPFAEAVRDGRRVKGHGDVFLTVWTYSKEEGIFTSLAAGNGVLDRRLKKGMLLVRL